MAEATCKESDLNACALYIARRFLDKNFVAANYPKGVTYAWGGGTLNGPGYGIKDNQYDHRHLFGFDCSGFVQYSFYQASKGAKRLILPEVANGQARVGELVAEGWGSASFDLSGVRPGDSIAFKVRGKAAYHHVSIYNGNRAVINAYGTGKPIIVSPLSAWHGEYWMIRRYSDPPEPGASAGGNACPQCMALDGRESPQLVSRSPSVPWHPPVARYSRPAARRRPGHPRQLELRRHQVFPISVPRFLRARPRNHRTRR
ncbi:NlpC/P60 family protein (plasmid) [Streptomycetaceae bacterium NBC_01309]